MPLSNVIAMLINISIIIDKTLNSFAMCVYIVLILMDFTKVDGFCIGCHVCFDVWSVNFVIYFKLWKRHCF